MGKKKRFYGIQRKLMIFTFLVAILPLSAVGVLLGTSIHQEIMELNIENYSYNISKIKDNYQVILKSFEELTSNYILNSNLQKSLGNTSLIPQEEMYVNRSLWYINSPYIEYGIYLDNKGNEYFSNKVIRNVAAEDIIDDELIAQLESDYASLKMEHTSIQMNGQTDSGVFLVRNVRHLDLNVEPGILILKLNREFYKDIFRELKNSSETVYFMLTEEGEICYVSDEDASSEELYHVMEENLWVDESVKVVKLDGNRYFITRDETLGFVFVSKVPNRILFKTTYGFLWNIVGIVLISALFCLTFSVIASKPYQKAIFYISETMKGFDESSLNQKIQVETNSELDIIAMSYNRMLNHINDLIDTVKKEQEELRKSEYNSLVYQINPHFLYNTLDNIYMLARVNGDTVMVELIQAFVKMLRIGLSKGENEIKLTEEIAHVESYLKIEQIRTDYLFDYDIQIEEDVKDYLLPKLILQPIAENSIKYGFRDLQEDGKIRISARQNGNTCEISLWNNGKPIDPEVMETLNQMQYQEIKRIRKIFPQKKGGYGISNVVSRLCIYYGQNFRFCYSSSLEDGTTCFIKIWKNLEASDEAVSADIH